MPNDKQELERLRKERRLAELEAKASGAQELRGSDSGITIKPAQPAAPQQGINPNEIISQIDDVRAADLKAQVDSGGDPFLYVSRNKSGAPSVSSLNEPSWSNYNPDATALDYMPQGAGLQRQAVAMRGATLGLGDEIAQGLGVIDGETSEALNMLTDKAYQERPGESFLIEGAAGLPAFGVGSSALGLRTGGAVTGGVYGGGSATNPRDRALGGVVGTATGGLLTSSGKGAVDLVGGAVNIGKRLRRASSGRPTVASNARDEFGIRLTQGQATNDLDQIAFEQAAARGGRSEGATQTLRPFMDDQREAVRGAGRGLAGDQFETANDAGAVVRDGLKRRAAEEQARVKDAYGSAREMNASLQPGGAQSMPQAVVSGLDGDLVQQLEIDPEGFKALYPNTAAALRTVANLGGAGSKGGLPFEQLENTRKILNRAIDASATNPADKRAAVQVKRSFDRFLDDAVDQKLFDGDDAFIEAYQKARGLRADFAKNFEANKVFDRIIKADASPEQTLEFILGAAKIAPTERVRAVVPQLRRALGGDSAEWAALQEAAMKRVMAQTDRTYNPKVLRDNLQDLLTGRNQTIAQELFSSDQYQKLRRFQGVVERLIPPEGAVNTSGTAYEIRRQLQSEGARIFNAPGGRTLMAAFQKYFPDREAVRAGRAVRDGVVYMDQAPIPAAQLPGASAPPPANAFSQSSAPSKNAFVGSAVQGSSIQGGAIGASAGAMAPADSNEERLRNMAIGGAAGAVGAKVAPRIDDMITSPETRNLLAGGVSPNGMGGGAQRRSTGNQIRNNLRVIDGGPNTPQPRNALDPGMREVIDATTPIRGPVPSDPSKVTGAQARGQLRDDLIRAGDDPQQVERVLELLGDDAVHVLRDRQVGPAFSRGNQAPVGDGGGGLVGIAAAGGAGALYMAIENYKRNKNFKPSKKLNAAELVEAIDGSYRRDNGLPPTPSRKPEIQNAFQAQ